MDQQLSNLLSQAITCRYESCHNCNTQRENSTNARRETGSEARGAESFRRQLCPAAGHQPPAVERHEERQPGGEYCPAIRDGAGVKPVSIPALRGIFRRVVQNAARYGNAFGPTIIGDDDVLPTVMSSGYKSASRSQVVLIYEEGRLRAMSFAEARRGQGFPDSFIFRGNEEQRWRQVGQAVPPPFAAAVAGAMLEARQGEIA
jgi:site-specific DNA-cytosine methylase